VHQLYAACDAMYASLLQARASTAKSTPTYNSKHGTVRRTSTTQHACRVPYICCRASCTSQPCVHTHVPGAPTTKQQQPHMLWVPKPDTQVEPRPSPVQCAASPTTPQNKPHRSTGSRTDACHAEPHGPRTGAPLTKELLSFYKRSHSAAI
jgi:hypothetical protein